MTEHMEFVAMRHINDEWKEFHDYLFICGYGEAAIEEMWEFKERRKEKNEDM